MNNETSLAATGRVAAVLCTGEPMNWFKWVVCWWHRRHIYTIFYDKQQRAIWHCVRCGHETDLPTPDGQKVGPGETASA